MSASGEREEQWEAVGTDQIRIDEGAGRLAWVDIATLLGTNKAFATEMRDAILAAHAQAGLAQEMRKKAPINQNEVDYVEFVAEFIARYDALTAGREAWVPRPSRFSSPSL